MCGPFLTLFDQKNFKIAWYHLGRLLAYSLLGGLAGWAGHSLAHFAHFQTTVSSLQTIARLAVALVFLLLALRFFFSEYQLTRRITQLPVNRHLQKLWQYGFQQRNHQAGALLFGLVTPLLPCGWLYSFVLAASLTQSPLTGAMSMALFALGTIPALSLSRILSQKVLSFERWQTHKILAVMFLGLSLHSLYQRNQAFDFAVKANAATSQPAQPACHHHH